MAYPRNAASPERIAIGAVVQISDGAVQTSGVSIKVKPQGTTASAGGGTTSYEEGIVEYVPTQAESNYTSFEVIAYKTGCIPVAVTVVTTASATAGTVLLAPTTHTSAVIPTVTTTTTATNLTNLPSIPANWLTAAGIAASALNGKGDWNIGKTGYALTATTGLGNQTANITGNLSGSVGSVTGAVGSVTGAVGSVTGAVGSVTGAVGSVTGLTNATVADAVWDEALAGHLSAGSTGEALDAATAGGGLDAAGVRAAIGLASANLDTQLADLPTNAELSTALAAADDATLAAIAALSIPTAAAVADAVLDEALSGHLSAGTVGAAISDTDLRGSRTVVRGTVGAATTPSATQFTPSALSPAGAAAGQFIGRILIFDNDTATASLRGQAAAITASTAAALPLFTFDSLTTAPASGDTFSIV